MCGFAGFVGEVENREQVLENMIDTIIHRGPDSSGKFVDEDAALGFRRLSIIDLSESGDQPLYNEDRSKVLVFNGEIYNYQELREELIQAGHTFVSNTDSETLIHGYEQWGEELVYRLRGMYAFAIWDQKAKRLFSARDIFGIKPLYYAQMNGTLMFGSEIKSFLEHPKFDKVFNEDALGTAISPMNPETPTALTCASSLNVGLCQRKRSVFAFLRKCRALIPMPTMGDAAVASAAPAMPIPSGNISTQSMTMLNRLDAIVAVMASDGSPSLRTKERRM